jgi:hypothetical protein
MFMLMVESWRTGVVVETVAKMDLLPWGHQPLKAFFPAWDGGDQATPAATASIGWGNDSGGWR